MAKKPSKRRSPLTQAEQAEAYGKNLGALNPSARPAAGSKAEEIFHTWGFDRWKDVLALPFFWDAANRDPKFDRSHPYTTLTEALDAYNERGILPYTKFYRDKDQKWHAYVMLDSP